ncbi:MAG: restriction endonuclease subunit S, partial [Bacilli bacterium]|nr:restriction endonuclease subunit S [Bacilli bacterium]
GAKHDMKIGNDEVLKNYVNFPSKEEQKKISDFLDLIDQRIETQNKIIDKCKSLIKCICDNAEMSANRQLKDIAYYNSSNVKESVVNNNGKYPVFGAAGICGYLDDYVFSKAGIAIVKDGAGVGRLLKIKNDKYSILGTMGLIETKNGISQDYLWLSLKKIKFEKYIVGSGIPHIYFSDYSSAQIPSFTDRNFIRAKLCDLLLEKIKIDEDILAKFLKQKEFLLNNLFI